MTGQDAPRGILLRYPATIALCAALLSSCSSTSDPVARLGLVPEPSRGALAVAAAADDAVGQAGAEGSYAEEPYYVVAEDDPELPEIASAVPSLQNRPVPDEVLSAETAGASEPLPERFAETPAAPVAQDAAGAIAAVQNPAQAATGSVYAAASAPQKRSGFLSSLFATEPRAAAPATRPRQVVAARPQQAFAAASPTAPSLAVQPRAPIRAAAASPGALPGVRDSGLFEVRRANGLDDVSDIDLHEDDEEPVQLASAAGLARLAPNGLLLQTDRVDAACLKPSLVRVLKQIEGHYGKKVMVTSGYRSPPSNRRARGATNSLHMYCAAADIKVEGVTKFELAQFARSMPGRGGVGTYCHTDAIHVDVGPERDWNWRCRRKKRR